LERVSTLNPQEVVEDQRRRCRVALAVQVEGRSTLLGLGVYEYLFSYPMPRLHDLEALERMFEGLTHLGEENLKRHVADHKNTPSGW
jgi:hypothetical protein